MQRSTLAPVLQCHACLSLSQTKELIPKPKVRAATPLFASSFERTLVVA